MRLPALLSICAVASLALACKPSPEDEQPPAPIAADDAAEQFARQICASMFACECPSVDQLESEASCVTTLTAQLDSAIQTRLAGAPVWDEECAGQLVAAWSDWACSGPAAASEAVDFDPASCPVIKGSKLAGVDCLDFQLGDDCAPGFACVSNVCVEAIVPVPTGQVCGYDWDRLPCAAGNYCDYDETVEAEICKLIPSAGDPCDPNFSSVCGPSFADLLCSSTGVCEQAPGLGGSCLDSFLCAPGFYCDGGQDFTCQPQAEIGGGCGANAVCPADSSCIGNLCEAVPAAACSLVFFQI